jgi:peptidoglycan/LPS O-acetylase OafA/YrhL
VLRGLAALYVMLGHARWLLWASQHEYAASAPSKVGSALAVLSASLTFGHQAVLLFFLISGFCIHYRQARSLATSGDGRMNLKSYAWRRLRRLYPPLLLALALTALFDSLGASLNPAYYAGQTAYPSINDAAVAGSRTLTTLFGGLLFQSSLATPSFGTNGPLWSLSYEFWFYALYPLLLVVSGRLGAWLMAALAFGASGVALLATQIGFLPLVPVWVLVVLSYWVVWACGALIAEAYVGRVRVPFLRWLAPLGALGVVYLAGSSVLKRLDPSANIDSPARDLQWGLALAVLLAFGMLSAPAWLARIAAPGRRILAPLGSISYSLYVVHFPCLALISAWWLSSHDRLPLGAELAIPGALSALVLAGVSWYFVERHFTTHNAAARRAPAAPHPSPAHLAPPEPLPTPS